LCDRAPAGIGPAPRLSYDVGMSQPPRRPPGSDPARGPRKDRVVQTRVPRALEATLKAEARRRRLSVSQLVRHVLEDTFHLVDGLVADVDRLVGDGVDLARNAHARARRIGRLRDGDGASPPRQEGEASASRAEASRSGRVSHEAGAEPAAAWTLPGPLDDVVAWNEVVLHRRVHCAACGAAMARGERGHLGLDVEGAPAGAWLCAHCLETL
jgi:hypothetical protein